MSIKFIINSDILLPTIQMLFRYNTEKDYKVCTYVTLSSLSNNGLFDICNKD